MKERKKGKKAGGPMREAKTRKGGDPARQREGNGDGPPSLVQPGGGCGAVLCPSADKRSHRLRAARREDKASDDGERETPARAERGKSFNPRLRELGDASTFPDR